MMHPEQVLSDRSALVNQFKAKEIFIPDLKPIFRDWPGTYEQGLCSDKQLDQLKSCVSQRLKDLYRQGAAKRLKSLIEADFASFTVLWWPRASLAEQRILAYLVIWLFTWDDEVDDPEGSVSDDFQGAEQYRAETERYVEFSLGLRDDAPAFRAERSAIVRSFDDIGVALCVAYNEDQRRRFFIEVAHFMHMSQKEQALRLMGQIPTLSEYWEYRMGTSAVYIGVAAGEYSLQCALPSIIVESPAMRKVWNETNIIISITNDLLSLRKEINKGCVESAVPLTCAMGAGIAEAVQQVVLQLQASKERFDRAAEQLVGEARHDSLDVRENVRRFVDVCQTNCTGNLLWSLTTTRYGMFSASTATGGGHKFEVDSAE